MISVSPSSITPLLQLPHKHRVQRWDMASPIPTPLSLLHGIWVLWLVGGASSAAGDDDDDDDEKTAHSNSEQSRRTYFEIFIFSVTALFAPLEACQAHWQATLRRGLTKTDE
ncbi:hypothetical protein EV359DRAFT_85046 [Lentinula novae-zelandiae]|nr:hypothetical protein EV359DRAFT_85046 [Lentinula novae-zelandiae]